MEDIFELLIYIIIGVVGLLATAYRNRQKRQSQSHGIPGKMTDRTGHKVEPDLGPLAEILGIPELARPKPVEVSEIKEENVEEDIDTIEKDGHLVEQLSSETDHQPETIESDGFDAEKIVYEGMPAFESTDQAVFSDTMTDSTIMDLSLIHI